MSDNARSWLDDTIATAAREQMCTGCTSTICGSLPLWRLIGAAAAREAGDSVVEFRLTVAQAAAIAHGLAAVTPEIPGLRHQFPELVVRFIVGQVLWGQFDERYAESHFEPLFAGSWAHTVLLRMRDHYANYVARLARNALSEAERQQLGEERRRERSSQHALRMAAQAEHNREWRTRQEMP